MRFLFLALIYFTLSLNANELQTAQGYAQEKDQACALSIEKALSKANEKDLATQCQCYRQDSRDWICYTYYKNSKKD